MSTARARPLSSVRTSASSASATTSASQSTTAPQERTREGRAAMWTRSVSNRCMGTPFRMTGARRASKLSTRAWRLKPAGTRWPGVTVNSTCGGVRSARPYAHAAEPKATAVAIPGSSARAARSGRRWPPRLCGPAWAPGANSQAPLNPVLSSHPRFWRRCAMSAGAARIPASAEISVSSFNVTISG